MTGFLISGTASGVGKTTATLAIAAALRRRGLAVQLFKGGPDFLDTGHHSRVSGRTSRNLDTWMLSEEANREVLRRGARGADALVAEGMMGLFDGKSGADERGSSAEIAKLLRLPVVLVVDAGKSARSIAAMVLGFELFDPELRLAGVILNRVASERHFAMLAEAITTRCRTRVVGWLPREPAVAIPERHLGLQTAEESETRWEAFAELAEGRVDLEALLGLECGLTLDDAVRAQAAEAVVRVGVAYDRAFSFYYEDNFDLLRECGAELVYFSPLMDQCLPEGLDALYLGGGYPEIYAEQLSGNSAMLQAIRAFADAGRPVYAECGGMMYLADSIVLKDGTSYGMAGVLPLRVEMTGKLVRFGYVTVEITRNCLLGPVGTVVRGHSFHYSTISGAERVTSSYRVTYSLSGKQEMEGFGIGNVLASYIHLHFRANAGVVQTFVDAAIAGRVGALVNS